MKTVKNCERMRCCEARIEKSIRCANCILKNTCKTSSENGVAK